MAQVKSDVQVLNDSNWEGAIVALLVSYIMMYGQLTKYLLVQGIPDTVMTSLWTLLIQRAWVYVRAGRQIAETKLQNRLDQMLTDAKAKAVTPPGKYQV